MSSGPEHNGSNRVKCKAHEDSYFVTLALQNFSCNGGEEEIAAAEVHNLETSRLKPGDAEHRLEMAVQNIEKTVGEAPEEEQTDHKEERKD